MREDNKNNDIKMLREWLSKQPHLPQNIHDQLLKRFLFVCNHSVEQSKTLIELFYTIRSQAPEIFDNRDPNSPELQETMENIDFLAIPKLTKDKNKIFVYRINSNNVDKYNFANGLKAFFLFADVRMMVEDEIPEGEIPIFDMHNFTIKHLTKIVLPVLKKYMVYTQEAHPIRLKEIHLVNVPSFIDRCMAIIRPFMKNEVIYTHLANSDTLFNHIPKEALPEEYGGSAGRCSDIKQFWTDKLMKNQDYVLDPTRWAVDENKRPDNRNKKNLFGAEGSFRSLSID